MNLHVGFKNPLWGCGVLQLLCWASSVLPVPVGHGTFSNACKTIVIAMHQLKSSGLVPLQPYVGAPQPALRACSQSLLPVVVVNLYHPIRQSCSQHSVIRSINEHKCASLYSSTSSNTTLSPDSGRKRSVIASVSNNDTLSSTAAAPVQTVTCRRCYQRFSVADNSATACRFHPAMYTGGEVAKAVGFVRESSAPEHQLAAVMGQTGLMRFWDCCGAADSDAPGCVAGFHLSFDDDMNRAHGWRE